MRRLILIVRHAQPAFRGSLAARFGFAIGASVAAGAASATLPALLGQAVAAVAGGTRTAPGGELARLVAPHLARSSPLAVIATALVATLGSVGLAMLATRAGSTLAGDLTAALRCELFRRVLDASPHDVRTAVAAETAQGGAGNAPLPRAAFPDGAPTREAPRARETSSAAVQLTVSREAAMSADFIVSVLTSLPQSLTTLALLTLELATSGAAVVLVGGGISFVLSRVLADRATKRVAQERAGMQSADGAVFAMLQESLAAVEDLRLWGARNEEVAAFARAANAAADARARFSGALAVSGQIRSVFTATAPLFIVVALSLGGAANGARSGAGDVAMLLLYVPLFLSRLEALDGVRQGLAERRSVLDAMLRLLSLRGAPARAPDPLTLRATDLRGHIVFEGVRFTPPGASRPVIDGVDLEVRAGQIVGICGPSGGGKSMLLRLLLRLDDPDEGRILVDGHELRRIEPDWLPRIFGVLRQTAQPLERSLRDNLGIGLSPRPDDDAMRAVLERVALSELAGSGERSLATGVRRVPPNFSGGELRRLLLARMLLDDTRIALLDEPEAGLPSATAEALLDGIVREAGGRTHLVVTHAPHLLRSDFNVVVEAGRIVAVGPHDELRRDCEVYQRLLARALADPAPRA